MELAIRLKYIYSLLSSFRLLQRKSKLLVLSVLRLQNHRSHWLSVAFGWQGSTSLAHNVPAASRSGGFHCRLRGNETCEVALPLVRCYCRHFVKPLVICRPFVRHFVCCFICFSNSSILCCNFNLSCSPSALPSAFPSAFA